MKKIKKTHISLLLLVLGWLLLLPALAMADRTITVGASQDLSVSSFSMTVTFPGNARFAWVTLHASTTISETITVTHDSKVGTNYDTVLKTYTLSSASSYFWAPDSGPIPYSRGDGITVTVTNGGTTGTVYVSIGYVEEQ